MKIPEIDLKQFNYTLPDERIAKYPARVRDHSMLLVDDGAGTGKDIFRNIDSYLPSGSLLVFNNTRVIRARIMFRKPTGAPIEILCLEPVIPADYALSLSCGGSVVWKCIVGNLKKWKSGTLILPLGYEDYVLNAERIKKDGEAWEIRFSWNNNNLSFGEVLDKIGLLPLPPYLEREAEKSDLERYQTVYSSVDGSVAAPTAGLHFTERVLKNIKKKGIGTAEITLHVGAGTFKPLKSTDIREHEMHIEHFVVDRAVLETIIEKLGKIIAVGTTSVRTLESIYWLGTKVLRSSSAADDMIIGQWDIYKSDSVEEPAESLRALLNYMDRHEIAVLRAATGIMIMPGYRFRIVSGMITNFHMPSSTLLLLVSAWTGDRWKDIYNYALENQFRFLSYGDSSLLLRKNP